MKSLLLVLAFSMIGANAFSENLESCRSKVYEKCAFRVTPTLSEIMLNADSCKDISNRRLALVSERGLRLTSIDIGACNVSDYTFGSGTVIETKDFDGRLFVTLTSGRVVMLGHDNGIYELMNSDDQPFDNIIGLRDQGDSILLTHSTGKITDMSVSKLQKRIDEGKLTILSTPR